MLMNNAEAAFAMRRSLSNLRLKQLPFIYLARDERKSELPVLSDRLHERLKQGSR